jgi:nicotinamide-nucleotide amidase
MGAALMNSNLIGCAAKLRDQIASRELRLVFAESCTGGWLAASMAALPGVSQWWCGSLIVYRCDSKQQWLGIAGAVLDDPSLGPVSELVTRQLAQQALRRTPEAGISLAVTGDLGPGVAAEKDGRIFCAMALRGTAGVLQAQTRLNRPAPLNASDIAARVARLEEASEWVFEIAIEWLKD